MCDMVFLATLLLASNTDLLVHSMLNLMPQDAPLPPGAKAGLDRNAMLVKPADCILDISRVRPPLLERPGNGPCALADLDLLGPSHPLSPAPYR